MSGPERIFCPSCDGESADRAATRCAGCGAALRVDGRYVLTQAAEAADAVDEVDAAAPLRQGWDLTGSVAVHIRLGTLSHLPRLQREATVLNSLAALPVPRALTLTQVDGVGHVLVLTAPPAATVESMLEDGLRCDGAKIRKMVGGLLTTLARMHALSPPVFHRGIYPGAVAWNGSEVVWLLDFARATDTAEDRTVDRVLARPGYQPARANVSAVQAELYAVGALAVHVLARRSPDQMGMVDGAPDFLAHVQVDEPFSRWLLRMLSANPRRGFGSAAEALAELPPIPGRQAQGGRTWLVAAAVGVAVVGGGAAATVLLQPAASAPAVPEAARPRPVTPDRPTPPQHPDPTTTAPAPPSSIQLSVSSTPPGATVTLGTAVLGQTPLRRPVTASGGSQALVLSKRGFAPAERRVVLLEDTAVQVTLSALPTGARPSPAVARVEDRWQTAMLAALQAAQPELEACARDGVDRVKLDVRVDVKGRVDRADVLGGGKQAAALCVRDVIKNLAAPPPPAAVACSVWVYLSPTFKVALY